MVKNLCASAEEERDWSSIPGSGRSPREGNGNPSHYSCLENCRQVNESWSGTTAQLEESGLLKTGHTHGQKSLACYSPCGCEELGVTEHTIQQTLRRFSLTYFSSFYDFTFAFIITQFWYSVLYQTDVYFSRSVIKPEFLDIWRVCIPSLLSLWC